MGPRTCILSMSSLDGVDTCDRVLDVRGGAVRDVNMKALFALECQTREFLHDVDKNGTQTVHRSDFVSLALHRPRISRLFDISAGGDEEAARAAICKVFDQLDFSK